MVKPQSPIAGKHSDKIRLVQLSYIGDLHGAVYTSAAHSSMANNSRITRTMCCRSRKWTRLSCFATRYTPQTLQIFVENTTNYFGKKPTEFSNMAINPRWRLLSKIRAINPMCWGAQGVEASYYAQDTCKWAEPNIKQTSSNCVKNGAKFTLFGGHFLEL